MKVGRNVPWRKEYNRAKLFVHHLPFLLVGGASRAARLLANKLAVNRITLGYPNLPSVFHGLTITHLSDLHLGPLFTTDKHLPPVISACMELNSDLICCTGDWVDYELDMLPAALKAFEVCRPRLGWVGVLGNHDYHYNRWQLLKILRPWLKDRLLINRHLRLEQEGECIDICGLDFSVGGARLRRGLEAIRLARPEPAPFTIGLAHFPELFDAFRQAHQIDLMLSGHTHGGQISWTPPPEPPCGPVTAGYRYCRGLYQVDGARNYVSCGLGATVPLRLNCPPEVTQFTLVREIQ